jgi:hypothetical protein
MLDSTSAEVGTEITETQPGNQTGALGVDGGAADVLTSMIDVAKRNLLLLECHRVVYIPVSVIASPDHDFYLNAAGWRPEDLKAAQTMKGFTVVDRTVRKIRITKVLGNKLVSDEYPANLPTDDFHFITFYCKRKKGQFWGKVQPLKDPQREINKRASQAIDIGNRMAAYNYFYDEGTFPDQTEADRFVSNSSEPGAVFKVNTVNNIPKQTEGTKYPQEIVNLMQMAIQHMDDLGNIVVEPSGANESGASLLQRQKLKLTGNEFLFDALTTALFKLGRLLVPIIKRYYPIARIIRIVRSANLKNSQQIDGQDLNDFTDLQIQTILEENDLEKFDLVVTEASFSPSARMAIFLILTNLAEKGVDIPPDLIVTYADMPEKEKEDLKSRLQQQQDAQNQAAQATSDGEIEKTLAAHGVITPSVAQRFGIQPTQQTQQPETQPQPAAQPAEGPPPSQLT